MFTIALDIYVTHKLSYVACCLRGDGVMDSVLACGAGEPGSIPALSKWFFSWVKGGRIKMDADTTKLGALADPHS